MSRTIVEVAGKRLSLSNLEKKLYPFDGFTKAAVLDYYRAVAPFMLPHLKDRAVTMHRYPDGTAGESFFEKRCPSHRPAWVKTAEVRLHDAPMTMCLVNDLETLLWAENLAALELHVPLARAATPRTPDALVFDLDPGEPASLRECTKVALIIRELLSGLGLSTSVKTSGKKGLHVFLPLNRSETTFEDTKTFSRTVAAILERHYPSLVTARMARGERRGKVFINWSQNDASKTMVSVYSLRAVEQPSVSLPIAWRELEDADAQDRAEDLLVTAAKAVERVRAQGDLFRSVRETVQKLPHL